MLLKLAVFCLCIIVVGANLNQGIQGNGYRAGQGGPMQNANDPYGRGQSGLGQGVSTPYNNQGGLGQGYNTGYGSGQREKLGQGLNPYNNGQNQNYNGPYGKTGISRNQEPGYTGVGYSGLGNHNNFGAGQSTGNYYPGANSNSFSSRQQASNGYSRGYKRSSGFGQQIQPQGTKHSGNTLGQGMPTYSAQQQSNSFGQSLQPHQSGGLGQNLRVRRYVEREPYRKTCKYICYRLYEKDAAIPHEFTCWQTYLGKKNCTETENILYLDRRNVEVDPDEQLNRNFYPENNDRQVYDSDSPRSDRHRQQDDEFGAIEQNMHNQRHNERRLPSDDQNE